MAITLRNKAVEERIRAIGRRTGEGPSAVIARLVTAEEPEPDLVSPQEAQARLRWWKTYVASLPRWTEEELAASKAFEEGMYDDNGLPQ